MKPFKPEDLPNFFGTFSASFECLCSGDYLKGARVFVLANSEEEAEKMFQKIHGEEGMLALERVRRASG